jgi:hypothetical protein
LFALILGPISLGSQIFVAKTYASALFEASQHEGYLNDQSYSLSIRGFSKLKLDIIGAANKCGIGEKGRPSGLLVDDLTYFAFMQSYLPQHQLGVSLWKGSITDPIAYLRSRNSDGIIVGCRYLSDDLRRRAKSQGEFCCLGPPNW